MRNPDNDEYVATMAYNRQLLKENTELRIQISYLQKEVARLKEELAQCHLR